MEKNLARQAELAFEQQGDYDTLCYEGAWHTSGQMADRGSRLGTGLAGLGVRPGDRLLVLMANCPEVLITYAAAWRAGAVVTPLIFLASEDELRHALNDSGAVGVVTTVEFLPKVSAAVIGNGAPDVRFVLVPGAGSAAAAAPGVPVLDFDEVASAEPGSIADRSGTDLAALLYTGGTTGRSKGVPLTHAGLYWCGSAAHEQSVRSNVSSSVLPLPLAHAYGLLVICGGMHRTDHTRTILMRWFDPAGWVKLAAEHKVQGSALVPSMIQMLLSQPLEDADLSSLVAISSGAAPLADDVRREFETRVPSATVYEGYGCTEAATFISANPWGARRLGSVGRPVPGVELTIQDEAGRVLPAGQDGEICVRSPGVMTGYWHSDDTSALEGGWLHTGDIGRMDEQGFLTILDRSKDMIISGGSNIYPREIEEVLLRHPAVAECSVVGRPHAEWGEEVIAFIVKRTDVRSQDLDELCLQNIARFKRPREYRFVEALPKNNYGKVLKTELRRLLRDGACPAGPSSGRR